MQETWVQSLGWEDALEEIMATQFSILALRVLKDRGAWRAAVRGEEDMTERLSTSQHKHFKKMFLMVLSQTEIAKCLIGNNQ